MPGIVGLTALSGYQVLIDDQSQASPESRSGNAVDPRHAERGEHAQPYSWQSKATQAGSHGPYGPENQLLSDEEWFFEPAGMDVQDPDFDFTPSRRAGPSARVLSGPIPGDEPDNAARLRQQSLALHGIRTNAGARSLRSYGEALNDDWSTIDQTTPGHTDVQPIGRQAMSAGFNFGTRDRVQSFARQNEFGFDSAHQFRRWATGEIPGNYMWLMPGGRVMRKTFAGPARPPIGVESPFEGNDLGAAFSPNGAVLQNVPREYSPPPGPQLAAPMYDDNTSIVEWY